MATDRVAPDVGTCRRPRSTVPHARAPMRRIAACGVALCSLTLFAAAARATSVVTKSFQQLCAEADVIFVATVTDVRSQWSDPNHRAIETVVSFGDVALTYGPPADATTLRLSGGELDDIREEVAGVPQFTVGERVLLFVRRQHAVSPIVGLNQGCFRIVESGRGPVLLTADGHPVLGLRNGALEVGPSTAGTENAVALPTFLEWVRQEVAQRNRE